MVSFCQCVHFFTLAFRTRVKQFMKFELEYSGFYSSNGKKIWNVSTSLTLLSTDRGINETSLWLQNTDLCYLAQLWIAFSRCNKTYVNIQSMRVLLLQFTGIWSKLGIWKNNAWNFCCTPVNPAGSSWDLVNNAVGGTASTLLLSDIERAPA